MLITKKSYGLIIFYGFLILFASLIFAQNNIIESIDIKKIRENEYTKIIEHVYWPSNEKIAKKKISTQLIGKDILEFKQSLKKVLKPLYLLKNKSIDSKMIPVEASEITTITYC